MTNNYVETTISIEIPEFSEKYVNSKLITFFSIEVLNNYSQQRWKIEKRYSEFESLHKSLVVIVPNVPSIPGKSLLKLSQYNLLTERRLHLSNFLKECTNRKDIMSNEVFKLFLELDKHSPELKFNTPLKLDEFTDLPLGIRDFYYHLSESILFIACCDMDITSRVDSYITNINMPWKNKINANHVSVGAVYIFGILTGNNSKYFFEKKWSKSFSEQTGSISFDSGCFVLLIGLDSGSIAVFNSPTKNYSSFQSLCLVKPHKDRVMGVAYDNQKEFIYSCSSDRKFYLTNINRAGDYQLEVAESYYGYTALSFDKKNERLFLSNEGGIVSVFLTNSYPPIIVQVVQTHSGNCIRGMSVYTKEGLIFTGTNKGDISVLDLDIPGREKYLKEMTYFEANIEIRIILYLSEKNEVITGDQNGRITIWSLKTAKPICKLQYH